MCVFGTQTKNALLIGLKAELLTQLESLAGLTKGLSVASLCAAEL